MLSFWGDFYHQPNDISNRFVDMHPAPNTVILFVFPDPKKHHFFQAKVGETKAQGLSEEGSEGEEGGSGQQVVKKQYTPKV